MRSDHDESVEAAGVWLGGLRSPRLLRLVADALDDTTQFRPTPTCMNIVAAWDDASSRAARGPGGIDISLLKNGPTLARVWKTVRSLAHRTLATRNGNSSRW